MENHEMNQRKPSPMVCGYYGSSTQFLEFQVRSREILATRMNGKIFQVKISILDLPPKKFFKNLILDEIFGSTILS